MSRPEGSDNGAGGQEAFERLDGAIEQALAQVTDLRARVRAVEKRNGELEALMARFESGSESPGEFVDRMKSLELENGDLRDRLEKGREAVSRILSRVRFMEEQS